MSGVYSPMRKWQRFRALDAADRRLLIESAAWLFAVRAGLAAVPFHTLRRALSGLSVMFPRRPDSAHYPAPRVAQALTRAARHLPCSTTCLIETLAAQAMLRRHGVHC